MNHFLGQVVKLDSNQLTNTTYFLITKQDRENGMYEFEDGNGNVFGAWDDVLSSVDTTEFLDAIQTGKVTNETIIRSWVKNQDLYR